MERVIVLPNSQSANHHKDLRLRWSAKLSLTTRILAVNILAIALLAGSLFYLNNYRDRLTEERLEQAGIQLMIIRDALEHQSTVDADDLIASTAQHLKGRIRRYNAAGEKITDSFALAAPTYKFVDPATEPWRKNAARFLDRIVEKGVLHAPLAKFTEPRIDNAASWPDLQRAKNSDEAVVSVGLAPDRTPVIIAGITSRDKKEALLLTSNARDITRIVRAERFSVILVIITAAIVSVLLSLFLARTIVTPIRKLARAATRVRMGGAQEISIPRMPERHDEIGQLANALADMSAALRHRIDATEAFAADVSHEIKNPLASLRSALEGLERVEDPKIRRQLLDVANDDVRRVNRLINDISDASRVDAELARAQFEPIDIGLMLEQLLATREQRATNKGVKIAFARPGRDAAMVMGDGGRLERVFSNLLDNAVSFSKDGDVIEIHATPDKGEVIIHVSDQGPGIPEEQHETIFNRFHSDRPESDGFGLHSGLGLAISKTIIDGHAGSIRVLKESRYGCGACFEIRLPKAPDFDQ